MEEKKIKGRKRHICVDTCGNLLSIKVHAANIPDTSAGPDVLYRAFKNYSSIRAAAADLGYRGTTACFAEQYLRIRMDFSSKHIVNARLVPIKKRWIVERFFAWIGNFRRLAKDYEYLSKTSEQIIICSAIFLLLQRLA